jgi:catechol 2,3-dioxygenase-like lactoylglutathione lyase family enzyme
MQHGGIHHVTAIAGPARRNHDVYVGTLGLRLVRRTVNFDDPETYHLCYGDEAEQAERVRKLLVDHKVRTTEQRDRNHFRSVYFREPGRLLFEIATDPPGFAVDEPVVTLGQSLKPPSFLELRRASIETVLPKLDGPRAPRKGRHERRNVICVQV